MLGWLRCPVSENAKFSAEFMRRFERRFERRFKWGVGAVFSWRPVQAELIALTDPALLRIPRSVSLVNP